MREDYDVAERECKQAHRESSMAHINYGILLETVRKYFEGAERGYKLAIALDQNTSHARINLATLPH